MIKIKRLRAGMKMPQRQTLGAAGYDLYTPEEVTIKHGRTLIPLGFGVELPIGYMATIRPRSGFSLKGMTERGRHADVILGTIDSDYRGEVGAIVRNDGEDFTLPKGTRIAQMVFQRHLAPELEEAEELEDTDRGAGGFGSTGTQCNK